MIQIQALAGSHDRQGFDCGRQSLNDWLRQMARQHQDKGLSKSFVAVQPELPNRICGFFALTLAELDSHNLPPAARKKMPSRIAGVRLARLAIDTAFQGKGLGELLLMDAMARARRIFVEAGGIGLFVDALDEQAAGFYGRYGFTATPSRPLLLFLPLQ